MSHDFGSSKYVHRYSSKGEDCTGIGGYMDYRQNPTKWSPCSVEDFNDYYKSNQPWCLTKCMF